MEKINLEEILWNSFHNNGIPKPQHTLTEITQKAIKEAIKEACKQTLELVAKKAKTKYVEYANHETTEVDKQSILDTINLIE